MTALTADKMSISRRWTKYPFTLASGFKAYKNAMAAIDLATGKVRPMTQAAGLRYIGRFERFYDATSGDLGGVVVNFGLEKELEVLAQDGGITLAHRGQRAAFLDDQTVILKSTAPSNAPDAGTIWDVDSRGVSIERATLIGSGSLSGLAAGIATAPAYVSNTSVIPTTVPSGSVLDVPTTGAASLIDLPATPADGSILYFVADGTKNAHTVQYRDQAGPVLLTAALTAGKRHLVVAAALNGKWSANAYVSP